jgi:hypothetical protein
VTRPTALVAWFAPFVVGAPLALAHCSGNDTNGLQKTNGDASTSSGDDGQSATPSGDGSSPTQGGDDASPVGGDDGGGSTLPPSDGGAADVATTPPPIPVPEGGAPSAPGSVQCGGAACDVSQGNSCCVTQTDAGPKETCSPPNTPCTGGTKLECDEAADCNGGVCCQTIEGIALVGGTSCMTSCPGGATFQTCRVDSECGGPDAGASLERCIPQTCTNANPMRSLKIEACAVPPGPGNPGGGPLAYCTAQ